MASKPLDEAQVRETYLRLLAQEALGRLKQPHITPSKTLRDALTISKQNGQWYVGVPHYWAVFYHDGRAAAYPKGKFLVWYKNPKVDPRHWGNYPVRANELVSLRDVGWSWDQVMQDVRDGKAVVSRVSPRNRRRVKGVPFFNRGLRGFFDTGGDARVAVLSGMLKKAEPALFRQITLRLKIRL
jgi:hypothetical protein